MPSYLRSGYSNIQRSVPKNFIRIGEPFNIRSKPLKPKSWAEIDFWINFGWNLSRRNFYKNHFFHQKFKIYFFSKYDFNTSQTCFKHIYVFVGASKGPWILYLTQSIPESTFNYCKIKISRETIKNMLNLWMKYQLPEMKREDIHKFN